MKKDVVNMEHLEQAIHKLEDALGDYNEVEKELIIKSLIDKRATARRNQIQQDALSNINPMDILKRVGKKDE